MGTARFKVVLTGDENVGKTSLVHRFIDDQFSETYLPTLGFQIFIKSVVIGDISVDFQIWDVAGQGGFEFARRAYYNSSQGFLLVFDVTKPASFQHVEKWISEFRTICPGIPFVLVGNKNDLPGKKITETMTRALSEKIGASGWVHSSAKSGVKVNEIFDVLGRSILTYLNFKV